MFFAVLAVSVLSLWLVCGVSSRSSLMRVHSYAKFNATSRKLNARLLQLGAVPLVDRGLGDEQSPLGIDGDLDAWLPLLWDAVLKRWPLPTDHIINDAPVQQRASFTVLLHPADDPPVRADSASPACFSYTTPGGCHSPGFVANIVQNARMSSPDWQQDVRHIVFLVGDHAYEAGDIAVIMPQNCGDGGGLVNRLLSRIHLKPADVLSIGSADGKRSWDASPTVVTAVDLVRALACTSCAAFPFSSGLHHCIFL